MELVPIIYTALEIVALLALLTLTFSYVSYRVKQRNGTAAPVKNHKHPVIPRITINKRVDEANKVPAKNGSKQAPQSVSSKPEPPKEEIAKPEISESPKLEPQIIKASKPKEPQREERSAKNNDSSKRRQEEKPQREKQQAKSSQNNKPRPNISRIEVLNNSQNAFEAAPAQKPDFQPTPLSKEKLNSLGDDYLDNYADDEDKDKASYTLKVKENKNNPEKKQ